MNMTWWLLFLTVIISLVGRIWGYDPTCKELKLLSATQSSTYNDLVAGNAIDGDPETMTHSGWEDKPSLSVTFASDSVGDVLIFNANKDCCYKNLNGAKVYAVSDDGTQESCGTVKVKSLEADPRQMYHVNCDGEKAATVKIQLPGKNYLHVMEVKVMRKCADDEKCNDKSNNCEKYREMGFCASGSKYNKWMSRSCNCCDYEAEMEEHDKVDEYGCNAGLTFCDGVCKHIHFCGKN